MLQTMQARSERCCEGGTKLDIVVERGLVIEMDKRQSLCGEMLLSLSRTDDGGD